MVIGLIFSVKKMFSVSCLDEEKTHANPATFSSVDRRMVLFLLFFQLQLPG